jgi:hypothetical protein
MERKDLTWILLLSVILVITASFAIPLVVRGPPTGRGQDAVPPSGTQAARQAQPLPGQEESKQLKTAISFMNFALGMYAITSNPLIVSLLGGRTGDVGLFQILPDLCTTVALLILVRISLE